MTTKETPAAVPSLWRTAVMQGGIVSSPVYEDHHRGKNWLACIEAAPSSPGGLRRTWLPQCQAPLGSEPLPNLPVNNGAKPFALR